MAASTDLLSGLTRSIKDDTFLSVDCLRQKVNEIGINDFQQSVRLTLNTTLFV